MVLQSGCGGQAVFLKSADRAHVRQGFDRTQLDHAIDLVGDLRYDEAMAILAPTYKALRESPYADFAAEAGFWLGYCQEKQGSLEFCGGTYQEIIARYPQTRHARLAQDRLDALSS